MRMTAPICTLLLAALGCDPEDLQVSALDASPDASARLTASAEETEPLPAVLAGTVALAADIEVRFFELANGSTGVLLVGPATSSMTAELEAIALVMRDAVDADEAAALMTDLVDQRGAGGDMTRSASPDDSVQPAVGPGGTSPDQFAVLRKTKVVCNGVNAPNRKWGANQGDCTLFARDAGEHSYFEGDDLIAYAGHVTAVQGSVFWDIRLQDWGVSGWFWGLQSFPLSQGEQAYWTHSDIHNDFNLTTRVESTSNNGTHHHDFARCHDWYARVNALANSVDAYCNILTAAGTWLYSHNTSYVGPDPSNIPTGIQW